MDRQIPIANRVVDKKMQEFRSRKHRQTLSQIKNKTNFHSTMYPQTPKYNRYSSGLIQNKILQIERQNIKLFNKIANIIRQKPKVYSCNSTYAKSTEQATIKHKKRLQKIKTENQAMQKRIAQQKSTINNKQFFKDRMKNLKYLKLIGRFPYQKKYSSKIEQSDDTFRARTEESMPIDIEIYRKNVNQFSIRITKISCNYYVFHIETEGSQKIYQYTMKKDIYEDQLMKCGYNYDKLVGQLRLSQKGEISFQHLTQNLKEQQEDK